MLTSATIALALIAAQAPEDALTDAQEAPRARRAEIADYLDRAAAFGFTGAVLVAVDGEVWLSAGYGLADRARGERITTDTIFDIGSLSKQFTAAAVLRACQNGDLTLETTLGQIFEEVPTDKRGVRIDQLLAHTSGLPYHAARRIPDDADAAAAIDSLLLEPIGFEPGSHYAYSNVGYVLLAYIVAEVSGRPFDQYLLAEVFGPAGLRTTGLVGDTRPSGPYARSYFQDWDGGSPAEWTLTPSFMGAGGVLTTIGDLWHWERALTSDVLLTAEWRKKLFEPHVEIRGPSYTYGFGWMSAQTPRNTRVVFHDGDFNGFNASYRRYVDEDVTLVLCSNVRPGAAGMREAVMNELSLLVQGEEVAWPPVVVAAPAPDDAWVGHWTTADGRGLVTKIEGKRLVIAGSGRNAAVDVLATGAPADANVVRDWENAIEGTLGPAASGSFGALDVITSPSVVGGLADNLARLIGQSAPQGLETGEVFGWFDVVGSRRVGRAGEGETIVRLGFADDGMWTAWRWTSGGLMTIRQVDDPARVELLPIGEDRYAYFDLFSDRTLTVELDRVESTLTVSGDGETVATRQG